MAWFRETLATIIARNQADIEVSLPGSDAKLRRTNLNIIAKIISACSHALHGHIEAEAKQIHASTADGEGLKRHATEWLEVPEKPASYAQGLIEIVGLNDKVIPIDTRYTRSDGAEYQTDAEGVIADGVATVSITAMIAGQTGNAIAGTQLSLSETVDGITGVAVVASAGITGGADTETEESVRQRVLLQKREPAHGGAKSDYVKWALEVPGVTRAWCYPGEAAQGTVTVRFVRDDDDDLIPDQAEVNTVQAYIDERRPVTAKGCYVVAPLANPLPFVFTSLDPATTAVKAAVEAELRDLIQREAIPNEGLLLSHIREAISIAAGEHNYVLASPSEDVTNNTGYITTFGGITWP